MATKERRKTPPGAPKYHRLTDEKRIIIEALRKEGCSKKHIAERVGCHPTTVWRELKRNVSKKGYRHKKAQGKANHRVAVKAAKRRRFTAEIWALAKDRLAKGWTFEQIHGRCKRDGIAMVCAETLYKEYYRRQKLVMAGKSDEVLPPLLRRQKKRRTRDRNANKYRNAGRGKITGRVDIDERPKTVENRASVGNWEGDLINGLKGTGNLVTLAERMTRFVFFAYAATKEAETSTVQLAIDSKDGLVSRLDDERTAGNFPAIDEETVCSQRNTQRRAVGHTACCRHQAAESRCLRPQQRSQAALCSYRRHHCQECLRMEQGYRIAACPGCRKRSREDYRPSAVRSQQQGCEIAEGSQSEL